MKTNNAAAESLATERFLCQSIQPARQLPGLGADLEQGFGQSPRMLPPKYFYDAHGSWLFEQICATPEYYPTRAEAALLAAHAAELIALARPQVLIELGSGAASKTRYLLKAAAQQAGLLEYWPFDVCQDVLQRSGLALAQEFPWLRVRAMVGDYLAGLAHLPPAPGRRLFVFLGGTMGNFTAQEAHAFLQDVRACMQPGDYLLLGADRVKARAVLEAAYNDAAGITAAFNLNVLTVVNRELGANFDLTGFRHQAIYNPLAAQIEMYLLARRRQQIFIEALQRQYEFAAGQAIRTEISRKFTPCTLAALLHQGGFKPVRHLEGGEHMFSLVLARPALSCSCNKTVV